MPAQFGNTKIGGMQYGGVTIGEAMMNGQVVYRSKLPSIYPVSGNWSGSPLNMETVASHTIVEAGSYTIQHEIVGPFPASAGGIRGPWGTTMGTAAIPSIATVTQTLAIGDLIEFIAGAIFATPHTGSWSIVKN